MRETQEIAELALKGLLRSHGIEAPRNHGVSDVLLAEQDRITTPLRTDLPRLAAISRELRRDREFAFYGAEDLTPSPFYSEEDATRARDGARLVVSPARPVVVGGGGPEPCPTRGALRLRVTSLPRLVDHAWRAAQGKRPDMPTKIAVAWG